MLHRRKLGTVAERLVIGVYRTIAGFWLEHPLIGQDPIALILGVPIWVVVEMGRLVFKGWCWRWRASARKRTAAIWSRQ